MVTYRTCEPVRTYCARAGLPRPLVVCKQEKGRQRQTRSLPYPLPFREKETERHERERRGRSTSLYPCERKEKRETERERERERDTFWLMGGLLPPQAPSKAKQTFWLKVPSSSSPTPWSSQSQRQAGASCARAPRTPRTPPLIRQSNLTATGTLSHRLRLVHHGGERDSSS